MMNSQRSIQDWYYSDSDVTISDTVLGRGAFGEVRIASWRGINIAAKKLHLLAEMHTNSADDDLNLRANIAENLKKEIELLSTLRHPNLVLFLGVCSDNAHNYPHTILTELMPGSLYDLLEVHKMKLTLPDIIDISLDILSCLQYLHDHSPTIIHRDISSKNILIGGNRAKLTDLGQAKVLNTTINSSSNQTGMPGAMAYSAPEVLTGKYSSQIDIFSFGVVLIQMCIQDYPRIDKREDQSTKAAQAFPVLESILRTTISFLPVERPNAASLCAQFKNLKGNDRYYPPIRKMSPQTDVGILARRWLNNEIEERVRASRVALEQTSRRLSVEEQRWRDEADRADKTEKRLREAEKAHESAIRRLESQLQSNTQSSRAYEQAEARLKEAREAMSLLEGTKKELEERIVALEEQLGRKAIECEQLKSRDAERDKQMKRMSETAAHAKETEERVLIAESELKLQLKMQVDECRELEARLEQALQRWKIESEKHHKEAGRTHKLQQQIAEQQLKLKRMEAENSRLSGRLSLYDSLPMPDEIKARLRDLEGDLEKDGLIFEELNARNSELQSQLSACVERNEILEKGMLEKTDEMNGLKEEMERRAVEYGQLERKAHDLEIDVKAATELCERLVDDKKALFEKTHLLEAQLRELTTLVTQKDGNNKDAVLGNILEKLKAAPTLPAISVPKSSEDTLGTVNRILSRVMASVPPSYDGYSYVRDKHTGAPREGPLAAVEHCLSRYPRGPRPSPQLLPLSHFGFLAGVYDCWRAHCHRVELGAHSEESRATGTRQRRG